MKFTKGQWKALTIANAVVSYDKAGVVEHVIARSISDNDAQLIAATPELYESLKAINEYLSLPYPENMKRKKLAVELMEDALAKAEGKNE
jgi:hypothetical protein